MKRIFISVDFEGLPHIVSRHHLSLDRRLFSEARSIATELVVHISKYLHERGFDEVVIADSHGEMLGIDPTKLPEYVLLVRGSPRPLAMVTGCEGCSAAIMLGYHAGAGLERATMSHTISGVIYSLKINGISASEYLMNTYLLGEMGIPVILVAGDRVLIENDVRTYTPWAVGVVLKESITFYSAKSYSIKRIESELIKALDKALNNLEHGAVKILKPKIPVEMEVEFTNPAYADVAELLPNVRRISGTRVIYCSNSMRSACRILELLVLASLGLRHIVER